MKRVVLAFFLICLFASQIFSYTIKDFKTLEYQISKIKNPHINKARAVTMLKRYLKNANKDCAFAMKIILLSFLYEKYELASKINFKIDGYDNEWKHAPFVYRDYARNVKIKNADLIQFKAYLDSDYNLYVMHKTLGRPLKRKSEEAFYLRFYDESGKNLFKLYYSWNGKSAWYKFSKGDRKRRYINLKFAVNTVGEAVIPLKQIYKQRGLKLPDKIQIRAGVYHPRLGKIVKRMKKNGRSLRWWSSRIDTSHRIDVFNRPKNYALELLLYLLQKNASIKGDSITPALALANNYLYSIADKQTRKAILKDTEKHFYLYKKILEQQKNYTIKYDLSKTGVLPKLYWAYRIKKIDWPRRKKLSMKRYREFVDSIENLYKVRQIVFRNNLHKGNSLLHIATKLERFARSKNTYRAEIDVHRQRAQKGNKNSIQALKEYRNGKYEKYYYGKKRRWDLFYWLNYQMPGFEKTGKYIGDCVTITLFQMAFYKALGIPVLANQIKSIPLKSYSHHSPFFYNAFLKRWVSIQRPPKNRKLYHNYLIKPRWHHKLYQEFRSGYKKVKGVSYSFYAQGEIVKPSQVYALRKGGISIDHFRKIFLGFYNIKKNFVYKNYPYGKNAKDSDNDGIVDIAEREFKTNPYKADSDSDGYSDLYEIERGFNPLSSSSKPDKINAVDGIISPGEYDKRVSDARGDYKATTNVFDVKNFYAKLSGDGLYMAVDFYNDVSKNEHVTYTFRVITNNASYLVQCYSNRGMFRGGVPFCNLYKRVDGKWTKIKRIYPACFFVKAAEIKVPLKYFGDFNKLRVWYSSTGVINGKKTNYDDKTDKIKLK